MLRGSVVELGLPASCSLVRRVPKRLLLSRLEPPKAARQSLEGVESVTWTGKLTAGTLHLARGGSVSEVSVLELRLREAVVPEALLRCLEERIPRHLLHVLVSGEQAALAVCHKTPLSAPAEWFYSVQELYSSVFAPVSECRIELMGLTLEAVYTSLVRSVAGRRLGEMPAAPTSMAALSTDVEVSQRREQLTRQAASLQRQLAREPQPRRKYELHEALVATTKELDKLQ